MSPHNKHHPALTTLTRQLAAQVRTALLATALLSGWAVQAATTIRFDHSFVVDTFSTTVDGVPGTPEPVQPPVSGSGQLLLSFGDATDTWLPVAGTGETVHRVRIALGFSSIDLLPTMLPLTVPAGYRPDGTSVMGYLDFSRTELAGVPVGTGAWTLQAMRLHQADSASRFDGSTFTIDSVKRINLLGPIFGLFDTSFADLQPLTIAQGFVRNDKCFSAGVCIPNNLFGYSVFQRMDTFAIGGGFSNINEAGYSGLLSLSNPVVAVPEPASAALLLIGVGLVGAAVRRTRMAAV